MRSKWTMKKLRFETRTILVHIGSGRTLEVQAKCYGQFALYTVQRITKKEAMSFDFDSEEATAIVHIASGRTLVVVETKRANKALVELLELNIDFDNRWEISKLQKRDGFILGPYAKPFMDWTLKWRIM